MRFLLNALVAVCGALAALRAPGQNHPARRWIAGAALAAILLSIGIIFLRQQRGSGSLNPRPYEYMGKVLADETVRQLGRQGSVAVWRLRIDNKFNRPLDAAARAFQRELGKAGSATLIGIEEDLVRSTGDLPLIMNAPSPTRFMELVQRYRDVDVLVLIGSVPTLNNEQIAQLPPHRPRIVMASIFQMPRRNLLERNVAQVIIAPRDHPGTDGDLGSPAEWFDCMYVTLTPATAATLRP